MTEQKTRPKGATVPLRLITDAIMTAEPGQLIAAGEAMDYAVKLKHQGLSLTGEMAIEFASAKYVPTDVERCQRSRHGASRLPALVIVE